MTTQNTAQVTSLYEGRILDMLNNHLNVVETCIKANINTVEAMADACVAAFNSGNKLMFCGNGGSAADAQHFSAEFMIRFVNDRPSLPAIALNTDTSALTACGNDYGYDFVFSRQIEGLGQKGDVLFAISTSGTSPNVVKAIEAAKAKGMTVIGLTGKDGGSMLESCDIVLHVADKATMHIQETHATALHMMCTLVESKMGFEK